MSNVAVVRDRCHSVHSRGPPRRRSSVRRSRRPRDVDFAAASDEAEDAPRENSWSSVGRCHQLYGAGSSWTPRRSYPQLPVLALRSLMSARPRRKERLNRDRLLRRVCGHLCVNLLAERCACHARRERVSATLVSKAAHRNSNIESVPLLRM